MVESYEDKNGNKVDWSEWHGTTTKEPPYDQLEPRLRLLLFIVAVRGKAE